MRERLEALKEEAALVIGGAQSLDELRETKVKYLGKKGELTGVLRGMGSLLPEERPVIGSLANDIRGYLDQMIAEKEEQLAEAALAEQLKKEVIDVTLPGIKPETGTLHPLQSIIEQVEDIFVGMGFEVAEGPEVETDQYNFEMLNLPKGHPARDMQDSFYITPEILLRTHTSSVQVRTLIEKKEMFRCVLFARVRYIAGMMTMQPTPINLRKLRDWLWIGEYP